MTVEPLPIRVLIVDDHTVVRFGLAAIIALQPDMTVAGEAASAEDACALCQHQPFDVVLMDLRLPGASGVDAIRTIRALRPTIRVIVLTTYAGDEDIHRALDAGAHAYLLKGMSHADVTAAVRKVHSGGRVIPEAVSKTLAERRPHSQLSPREVEVLQCPYSRSMSRAARRDHFDRVHSTLFSVYLRASVPPRPSRSLVPSASSPSASSTFASSTFAPSANH